MSSKKTALVKLAQEGQFDVLHPYWFFGSAWIIYVRNLCLKNCLPRIKLLGSVGSALFRKYQITQNNKLSYEWEIYWTFL